MNNEQLIQEELQSRLDVIDKANDASVLMKKLMRELDLPLTGVTQAQFLQAFTELQKSALEAKAYMQENYMLPTIDEKKSKRKKDV